MGTPPRRLTEDDDRLRAVYSKPSLSVGAEPVTGEGAGELAVEGAADEADDEPAVVGNGRFTGDDRREFGAEGVPSEPLYWPPD